MSQSQPQSKLNELTSITDALLFQDEPLKLREAAERLHALFSTTAGVFDDAGKAGTILPTGKALSPGDAANCVLDFGRTAKFLRGVYGALLKAQEDFPDERLQVVYAGCGPFATLMVPIVNRFDPLRIGFTLIDIHRESLDSARRIVEEFGLSEYVRAYRQADTTSYVHDEPMHVLIIESMQRALLTEPQVAVTLNLAKQMRNSGILVPEEIVVELMSVDLSKEFGDPDPEDGTTPQKVRIPLGEVLRLSVRSSFALTSDNSFVACVIQVPPVYRHLTFTLFTRVRVFGTIEVGNDEAGITLLCPLHDLHPSPNSDQLEFTYRLGKQPGWNYRWI